MLHREPLRETSEWLSTGQAARYCSVKPDTILKWIKRGKVEARRTAGGHYRILRTVLEPLVVVPYPSAHSEAEGNRAPLRCWEYIGRGNGIAEPCRDCIVLQSRAALCFELTDRLRELGHDSRVCAESCEACAYYQRVRGQATCVLVISRDEAFCDRLRTEEEASIALRFARNGYDASAVIHDFRPSFVVIDHDVMRGNHGRCLVDHLVGDARVPGVRVLLAVRRGQAARVRAALHSAAVVAVLDKPFGPDRIRDVVDAFPVEVHQHTSV